TAAAHQTSVILARARLERDAGSPDSAAMLLGELLAREKDNAAALLEMGRTRFTLNRRDGADYWYHGLAVADTATLALYRTDLAYVMSDSTLKAFDEAAPEGR